MKTRNLCVYAGLCAGVASMATGQAQNRTLQQIAEGQHVEPIQIAKVAMKDGKVVFQGDWMPYNGNTSRGYSTRVFDCFGDADSDGFMDDDVCDIGSSRFYFGTGFSNLFVTNDMTLVGDAVLDAGLGRADFAWFWTAGGSGTSETCVIAVFTQDANHDNMCVDGDTFDYSGFLLDFGTLPSGVGGGYYYTNVDLGSSTWAAPTDGNGSYIFIYASEVTTDGAFILATAAQPMLWGTGDDIPGYPYEVVGTQDYLQLDEIVEDLFHEVSTECVSYIVPDICPPVLGAMIQFWGERSTCYADFNGDGVVNTQDFLAYLGAWAANDMAADCNSDGTVNTQDFLCFLSLWAAGC